MISQPCEDHTPGCDVTHHTQIMTSQVCATTSVATRRGHPAAGAALYGVVAAESVLYRTPMIPLFRHEPSEPDPTFFLNTDMWDL